MAVSRLSKCCGCFFLPCAVRTIAVVNIVAAAALLAQFGHYLGHEERVRADAPKNCTQEEVHARYVAVIVTFAHSFAELPCSLLLFAGTCLNGNPRLMLP